LHYLLLIASFIALGVRPLIALCAVNLEAEDHDSSACSDGISARSIFSNALTARIRRTMLVTTVSFQLDVADVSWHERSAPNLWSKV
jgi:hypothetical protein